MTALVTHVDVELTAVGTLDVSWIVTGSAVAVDVAHGPTPETIDHTHAVTLPAGVLRTTLSDMGEGPHFVSVGAHDQPVTLVAGERRVRFEGLQNFRDLGGYASAFGGRTKWGKLFRADSLHKLTAGDHLTLARFGLKIVADLRSDNERLTHPNPLDSIQYEVIGRPRPTEDNDVPFEFTAVDGEQILRDIYVGTLVHSAELFGRLLGSLALPDALPAVFHCHAGKDRTGMVAALVLLAVGVDREDVLADYELTRRYRTLENQQDSYANMIERGMSPEAAAGVLATPRWAMEDALDDLAQTYGGVERFLTGPAAMTAAQIDALRTALVG